MSFSDNLFKNLSLNLNSIIEKYKALDDFSPFTLETFENCKKIISNYEEKYLIQSRYLSDNEKKYFKNVEKLIHNFNQEKINLEKNSNEKILNLTKTCEEAVMKIDDSTEIKNNELYEKITEFENELKEFIDNNAENIKMFETECKEKNNSYDYQIKNANISYNDNIELYNEELYEKIEKENAKHEADMAEYEESMSKIKERYNNKILSANLELNDFSSNFSMVQTKQKEEKKQGAIELNNKIRILYDDNNRLLIEEKDSYEKNKTINKIEKDRKYQEYILNSKQISNEFFLSMKKLNEKTNISKNQYNKSLASTKKKYQSKFFNINKIYENDMRAIQDETNKFIYKDKAKSAASTFNKNNKANKKLLNEEIEILNNTYKKIQTSDNYEKKQADIHRKYNLEAIDERETRDNKYFQEVNNLDENEYSFKTKMLNYKYNEQANTIRYEASLKSIAVDSEFEKENAIYQKNIQTLMNNVKKTRNELDSVKKLNEKVRIIENKRHETSINFLTVFYLLEIEKIRVLDDYNHKAYNLNLLNSNTIFDYSKKNIELQNDRKTSVKDASIEIAKAQNAQDIYDLSIQRRNIIDKNDLNINLERNNYSYKSTLNLHSFFKDRFILELKIINDILSTYTIIIKQTEEFIISLFKECSSCDVKKDNFDFFKGLLVEFNKEFIQYFNNINNVFLATINVYIEDRSKFESDYKFNSLFEEIHGDYKNKVNAVLEQMTILENNINTIVLQNTEYQKSISTLNSQIYYLNEQSNKFNKKENKKKTNDLSLEIDDLSQKIHKNELDLIPLNEKKTELNLVLQSLSSSYDKQTSKLDDIESKSTEAYYELKKKYNQILLNIKDDSSFKNSLNADTYMTRFEEKREEFIDNNDKIINSLYEALNEFSENVNQSYVNEYNLILENNINEINILNNEHKKLAKVKGKELRKERENNYKNINRAKIEKRLIEINYLKGIRAFNKEYDKALRDILDAQNINMQQFYDDYYAVVSNQNDIIENYYSSIKQLDFESMQIKSKIVHESEINNNNLDDELKKFIHSKDVLIKNIPDEIKDKKDALKSENKKLNNDIKTQKNESIHRYIKQKDESNHLLAEINEAYKQRLLMVKRNKKHEEKKAFKHHNMELKKYKEKKYTTL
ncbi:MAG: hypothetical protein K6E20_00230 [Acholeplasmatales bacterium]|nr:hypothetical protein [Acholeplasmatales bacterium]